MLLPATVPQNFFLQNVDKKIISAINCGQHTVDKWVLDTGANDRQQNFGVNLHNVYDSFLKTSTPFSKVCDRPCVSDDETT